MPSDQEQGITAYAVYVPRHRLQRAEIAAALEVRAGRGARVVASYDEDSTTLAVEAARPVVAAGAPPGHLFFATTSPAYLDKANASAIHAALDLGHEGFAVDVAGSARSGVGALLAARASSGLALLADVRVGQPGSFDESGGADGAAAFAFGSGDDVAVAWLSEAASTAEFLDRWRAPGEPASRSWEERFGLETYVPLAAATIARALAAAGLQQTDHVVVSSPHARAAASIAKAHPGRVAAEPTGLGYAGAADLGLQLAAVLDRARPGETILLVSASDGCDAHVLLVTDAIEGARRGTPVATQLDGGLDVGYTRYVTWRGLLDREAPRRPEPDRPAGPPSQRSESWKFGFVGSACTACGQVHVPPRRVCAGCGRTDEMERRPLAHREGTVATFTVDRLAFSPSPPVINAVVDFDGGGRYTLEVADAEADDVAIGTRLGLTFRRLYTTGGVHNYFWKARPR